MNKKNDIVPFWLYSEILEKVLTIVDNIDTYTANHCKRVGLYTGCFLKYLWENDLWTDELRSLKEYEIKDILYTAFVHDIGKSTVFADIIKKKDKLTEEEWKDVVEHSRSGAFFFLADGYEIIRDGILMHHERYDGKGYPLGLKGKNISVGARIISIIDSFDAMTDKRPYAKFEPMNMEQAIKEIQDCQGTQFDPLLSSLFISMCSDQKYQFILNIKEHPRVMNKLIEECKDWIKDEKDDFKMKLVNQNDNYVLVKEKRRR